MSGRSLIGIVRNSTRSPTFNLDENNKNKENKESSKKQPKRQLHEGDKYIREKFAIWQENDWDDDFDTMGIAIWTFLNRYKNEWSQEKRDDYLKKIDNIKEASIAFQDKAVKWAKLRKSGVLRRSECFETEGYEYLSYMSVLSECKTEIFRIIEKKMFKLETKYASADWPCRFGGTNDFAFLIDFTNEILYVLADYDSGSSCPLLQPIEKIYQKKTHLVAKMFNFNELPDTAEKFLIEID